MESYNKKSLKHKLDNALLTTSSAKKPKKESTASKNDSGIGRSVSSKKKLAFKTKKHASTSRRCLIKDEPTSDPSVMDITQLLALGEGSQADTDAAMSIGSDDSDLSDWEEVANNVEMKEPVIPSEGVSITLEGPVLFRTKKKNKQDSIEDELRRQLNRRQKEIQLLKHKVHSLCWIAHVHHVNSILNSQTLLSLSLSLISSKSLYPPKHADLQYLERIVAWFRKKIAFKDDNSKNNTSYDLESELTSEFEKKESTSSKHYIFLFVVILRCLGMQTRLITSFVIVPLKPENGKCVENPAKAVEKNKKALVKECKKQDEGNAVKGKQKTPSVCTASSVKEDKTKIVSISNKAKGENQVISPAALKKEGVSSHVQRTPVKRISNSSKTVRSDSNNTKNQCDKSVISKPKRKSTVQSSDSEDEEYSKHFRSPLKPTKKASKTKSERCSTVTKDAAVEISRKSKNESGQDSKYFKSTTSSTPKAGGSNLLKNEHNSDDDFSPSKGRKSKHNNTVDRKVLTSDEDSPLRPKKAGQNYWVEVFLEAEEKWISVDLVKGKIHCVKQLYSRATQPVTYVIAANNDLTLKDVTKRYVPHWHSDTRKRRVPEAWWNETMWPYLPAVTAREREEDDDITRQLHDMPMPKSISEYKFHPLYALQRHLLKFEGIYPPDAPPLGYVRKEPVYARECVVTLRSRDIWFKEARIVRPNQEPYKIVTSRPKYDKMTGEWKKDLPLELFGVWQTEEYIPPNAVDGKVPRNEYGNVDLFKPCMLPGGTVHLQIPALNRVAKKLGIDCAPAIVGFEFHSGGSHPVQDGFVVCEEFKEQLLDAWNKEIDESAKRAEEKRDKRIYGNWRKLIRGLLIRENLKMKYAFGEKSDDEASPSTSSKPAAKSKKSSSKK